MKKTVAMLIAAASLFWSSDAFSQLAPPEKITVEAYVIRQVIDLSGSASTGEVRWIATPDQATDDSASAEVTRATYFDSCASPYKGVRYNSSEAARMEVMRWANSQISSFSRALAQLQGTQFLVAYSAGSQFFTPSLNGDPTPGQVFSSDWESLVPRCG